jgi:anti-sigma factor RsiW
MSGCARLASQLDGYHDGELGRLRRWRIDRHLARCPGCRAELEGLARLGAWVRDAEAPTSDPDLWSELAARLPRAAPAGPARAPLPRFAPFAGVAVAAGAAAMLWLAPPGVTTGETASDVVRSINTHGRPVMVLDAGHDTTVIWLMDDAARDGAEEVASVWI